MLNHMVGVFRLSPKTFEEVEYSKSATGQAAIIVAGVALLSALRNGTLASGSEERFLTGYFLTTLVWTFISWLFWAMITYLIGTALSGSKATFKGMLRVIGFAYTPLVLSVIPCAGWLVGALWSLASGFVAVRQSFEMDNLKAAMTILAGFAVYVAGSLLLGFLVGRTLPLISF